MMKLHLYYSGSRRDWCIAVSKIGQSIENIFFWDNNFMHNPLVHITYSMYVHACTFFPLAVLLLLYLCVWVFHNHVFTPASASFLTVQMDGLL